MSDISSLQELREHGFTRGEAYACRLATARRILSEARWQRKKFGLLDAKYQELTAECAAARKVIRSSLRSLERWERGQCGGW